MHKMKIRKYVTILGFMQVLVKCAIKIKNLKTAATQKTLMKGGLYKVVSEEWRD